MIAEELDIKSPSLYNHISSLGDIKESFDLSLDIIINGIKSLEGVK